MREVLRRLNATAGVKGSLVLTPDGIVVISDLSPELDGETTAALVGNVVTQTMRLLEVGEFNGMEQMILTASRGKIVIQNLDNCLLVVVTNQFINLDVTLLEISSAAKLIKRLGRIAVS
jgi:predicted regulator of Ras-like GTPase activity (Roadblock/LC7/MglB family)